MLIYEVISLVPVLFGATVPDGLEERLHPLSETQIASAFSGKVVNSADVISSQGYGIFCPDGRYVLLIHRAGNARGTYVISHGVISVNADSRPPYSMRFQILGDGNGEVYMKRNGGYPVRVQFEAARGWCA